MLTTKMKLLLFCLASLGPVCGTLADEVILSPSPDGKFALRLAAAAGGSAATIVEAKSHTAVTDEDALHFSSELPNSDGVTKLVWSADSRRVAYGYTEHNRNNSGATVQVFLWTGSKFTEVILPDLPRPKMKAAADDGATRHFEKLMPLRWLKPATLVLSYEVEMGNEPAWTRIVRIGFDARGKATIEKVERKKE